MTNMSDPISMDNYHGSGIYAIVNAVSGRTYVGSAYDIFLRVHRHRKDLRAGNHRNSPMQRSYDKHGEDAFVIMTLERCSKNALWEKEDGWIKSIDANNRFNLLQRAPGRPGDSFTQETKDRIKESLRKTWEANPHLALAARARWLGRKHKPESVAKTVAAHVLPYRFIHDSGEVAEGINRAEFYRLKGLNSGHMTEVCLGKRHSCKGWRVLK